MKIKTDRAIEFILSLIYTKELETEDKIKQHQNRLNFYEWLEKHNLI